MEGQEKNIVSLEERVPNLQQIRRRKTNRRLIFYLSLFFFLIALVIYLQSPLSHIKHIEVSGNEMLTEEDVIAESALTTKTNIWTVRSQQVEKTLAAHPMIDSVQIEKQLPNSIKITIMEHKHVGYVKEQAGFYSLLGNGELLSLQESSLNGEAPLIVNFQETSVLQSLAEELNQLPNSILNLISEIHYKQSETKRQKMVLYMTDGYTVEASLRNFAKQMQAYPSIVAQLEEDENGVIHIGVGAYFQAYEE